MYGVVGRAGGPRLAVNSVAAWRCVGCRGYRFKCLAGILGADFLGFLFAGFAYVMVGHDAGNATSYDRAAREAVALGREMLALVKGN